MLRRRRHHGSIIIFHLFTTVLAVAVLVFAMRVASRQLETPFSVGQVMHLTHTYQMGNIYDRKGNVISEGSELKSDAFATIAGIDIYETAGKRDNLCSNALWIYGTEENELTMKKLFTLSKNKIGGDVQTTLDLDLQEYIAGLIQENGYNNAYAIVSNYKTGQILAMYSNSGNPLDVMLSPGSTIKPFLYASALTMDPSVRAYSYDCEADTHDFGTGMNQVHINCAGKANHGVSDAERAMAKSCNAWFISLLDYMDPDKLCEAMKVWGFDSSYSFSQFRYEDETFAGKTQNITSSAAKVAGKCLYALGCNPKEKGLRYSMIGQGNARITPAAMNFLTGALLNEGVLKDPTWLKAKRTASTEGEWKAIRNEQTYQMCEKDVADTVVQAMSAVMTSGTGRAFAMPEYGLAGKTGTAQKAGSDGKLNEKQTVWFTGGLAGENASNTPYTITVALDDVDDTVTSAEAGTLAKEVLTYMLEEGGKYDEN